MAAITMTIRRNWVLEIRRKSEAGAAIESSSIVDTPVTVRSASRRANSVQIQAVSPTPHSYSTPSRSRDSPYTRLRHRERDPRRAMTIEIGATMKVASSPRNSKSSEHLFREKENTSPTSLQFQSDMTHIVNNTHWSKIEDSSVFVLPEPAHHITVPATVSSAQSTDTSSPFNAAKLNELQLERDELAIKLSSYRKSVGEAMARLKASCGESIGSHGRTSPQSSGLEPGQKLMRYLDAVLESAKDREQTLISRLEETRNEMHSFQHKDDTEKEKEDLAKINDRLVIEKEALKNQLDQVNKDLESVKFEAKMAQVSVSARTSHASNANDLSKSNRPSTIEIDTNVPPELAMSPSQESPPRFVKEMRNLQRDFDQTGERMQSRVQELSNINNKHSSHSTSSSVYSGSQLDLNAASVAASVTAQPADATGLLSCTSCTTSPENQPIRRRRTRNGQTAAVQPTQSGTYAAVCAASSRPTQTPDEWSVSEQTSELVKLEALLANATSRIDDLQHELENRPSELKIKPYAVVANKTATKKIKELLVGTTGKQLKLDIANEILQLLNQSEHDENYKLLNRERWEAAQKKLTQLEKDLANADNMYSEKIEQESRRHADFFKADAQKQIQEYKDKIDSDTKTIMAEHASLIEERKELKQKIKQLANDITDYRQKTTKYNEEARSLEERTADLGARLQDEKAASKRLKGDASALREEIANIKDEMGAAIREKERLEGQLAQNESVVLNLEEQLERVKRQALERLGAVFSLMQKHMFEELDEKLDYRLGLQREKVEESVKQFQSDCRIVEGLLRRWDQQSTEESENRLTYDELEERFALTRAQLHETTERLAVIEAKLEKLTSLGLSREDLSKTVRISKREISSIYSDWLMEVGSSSKKIKFEDLGATFRQIILKLLDVDHVS